ncbi:hypothetical protein AAFF_G00302550 [Aldrovandia affinis]|uniref:Uncharacterized protein n=1 Tax=Aldrovandia affinis TaxID=143900 RepID=A0AAD7W112_9TELE|nr:hypothetical protein AAFF_G00302550 [Aldrovandia affinis]
MEVLKQQLSAQRPSRPEGSSERPSRPKYMRAPPPQGSLPAFGMHHDLKCEKVLQLWYDHMCGDAWKQQENARQKIKHVREWMAFMCSAGVPTMRLEFLKDLPRLKGWIGTLAPYAVTTKRCRIMSVSAFLKYLQRADLVEVKADNEECEELHLFGLSKIVDAKHVTAFLQKSAEALPAALATHEANPTHENLCKLYGLLSGYAVCLTGHRRGVLENMKAEEVLNAQQGRNGERLIKVIKHKTASVFGHAHLALSKEEYLWFARFLEHRQQLAGGNSELVFFNTNGGIFKRLLEVFQEQWAAFRLPGCPTFSLIRSSISTFAGRSLGEKDQLKVRRLMAHSQVIAEAFYEAEDDIREAWEARQLTCQAIAAQVSRPRERTEAKESDEDMSSEQSEDETPSSPAPGLADIAMMSEEETDEDMPALEESEEERPALPRQDSTCPVTLQQIHEDMNPSRSPESSTPKKNKRKSADCKISPIINRLRSKFTKTPPRKSLNQLQRIRLAGRSLGEKDQLKVRRLMAHSQGIAEAFYEAEDDIREAWEARQLTCQAIAAQVSRPRERTEAKESDEDVSSEQSEDETPSSPAPGLADIALMSEEETDEDMPALEESEEERPALPRQDSLQQIHEDIINPSRSPESSTPKKNKGKSADCKTSPIINRLRSKFTKTPPRKSLNQLQRIRLIRQRIRQ